MDVTSGQSCLWERGRHARVHVDVDRWNLLGVERRPSPWLTPDKKWRHQQASAQTDYTKTTPTYIFIMVQLVCLAAMLSDLERPRIS
jgi:hypothetical protein